LSQDKPFNTGLGKLTISADVSIKNKDDSIVKINIEADGDITVDVNNGHKTWSITIPTAEALEKIVSGAAGKEQQTMEEESRPEKFGGGWINTATDSQDYDVAGETATVSVGWGHVSASLEGETKQHGITISYTLTVSFEVEIHPAKPNVSPQLERVIQAGEKAAGITGAALGSAAIVVIISDVLIGLLSA
jgi:hypothetical protein